MLILFQAARLPPSVEYFILVLKNVSKQLWRLLYHRGPRPTGSEALDHRVKRWVEIWKELDPGTRFLVPYFNNSRVVLIFYCEWLALHIERYVSGLLSPELVPSSPRPGAAAEVQFWVSLCTPHSLANGKYSEKDATAQCKGLLRMLDHTHMQHSHSHPRFTLVEKNSLTCIWPM